MSLSENSKQQGYFEKLESDRKYYKKAIKENPSDVDALLEFIKLHSWGMQNPDRFSMRSQLLYDRTKTVYFCRNLIYAYYSLIPLKGIDFVQLLFWENDYEIISWAFESRYVSDNREDKETASKLLVILGENNTELVTRIKSHYSKVNQEISGIDIFTIVLAMCFCGLYDRADNFLTAFMPECYYDAPQSAYTFISALIHESERYDFLCKHLPVFFSAWGAGENRPDLGFYSNKVYWIGRQIVDKELPFKWREQISSIYLEFAQEYLFSPPERFDKEYFTNALKYAKKFNPMIRKDARKLSWQYFKKVLRREI